MFSSFFTKLFYTRRKKYLNLKENQQKLKKNENHEMLPKLTLKLQETKISWSNERKGVIV
jgi:hypothetical protein